MGRDGQYNIEQIYGPKCGVTSPQTLMDHVPHKALKVRTFLYIEVLLSVWIEETASVI